MTATTGIVTADAPERRLPRRQRRASGGERARRGLLYVTLSALLLVFVFPLPLPWN